MTKINKNFFDEITLYEDKGLRDYQVFNKHEIYKKWIYKKSILMQMPTGTGKTRLFVSMLNDFKKYCRLHNIYINVLIITHRKELVEQIKNELFWNYNIGSTLITAECKDSHLNPMPVCIASIQTLQRRLEAHWSNYPFDFVIVDEAHHTKAATYKKVINTFNHSKILGVTATPYRLNGEGFTEEYEDLIVSPSVKRFIEAGWLSNYDYYSIKEDSELYTGLYDIPLDKDGDYAKKSLWHYMNRDQIKSEIIGSYIKYARGKKTIIYTINKAHNKQLCQEFKKCGIFARAIDSDTTQDERKLIVEEFRKGHIDVLCNVDIFTEGFDCPDVEAIQLARPTRSLALYLQQVGRGLRIARGKRKVIFLDNVGLHNKFGFPASKRMWYKHFVGQPIDEATHFVQTEQEREPFDMKVYNRDLSEGCEEMILIESTGINNIVEEAKANFIIEKESRLKKLISDIFDINRRVFEEFVTEYSEQHMSYTSELVEDLVTPCTFIDCECEDLNFWKKQIKKEFKPIIKGNAIVYGSFFDIDDYIRTKSQMILSRFNYELRKARSFYFTMLEDYSAKQLYDFFLIEYGKSHIMTKKFETICLCGYESLRFEQIVKLWNSSKLLSEKKTTEKKEDFSKNSKNNSKLQIGDKVVHNQWGNGTIKEVILEDSLYSVEFDSLSADYILENAESLQKINKKEECSSNEETGTTSHLIHDTKDAKKGDWLIYNSKRCKVISRNSTQKRLTVEYDNKVRDNIPDNSSCYTFYNINDAIPNGMKKIYREACVGDKIMKNDDLSIGDVIDIEKTEEASKVIVKFERGTTDWFFNDPKLFCVLINKTNIYIPK